MSSSLYVVNYKKVRGIVSTTESINLYVVILQLLFMLVHYIYLYFVMFYTILYIYLCLIYC